MISVIVTAYNLEKYIEKCIISICKQTYRDIEIIIIDDGSIDCTAKILNKLAAEDNRITCLFQNNRGVAESRNKGIDISHGEYIMFVDGDDILDISIIERLYQISIEGYDVSSCCCKAYYHDHKYEDYFFGASFSARTWKEKEPFFIQIMDPIAEQPSRDHAYTAIGVAWGKIYKKSFLLENNLKFVPELRRLEDTDFSLKVFGAANSIFYLNEALYHYSLDHITSVKAGYSPNDYIIALKEREKFFEKYSSMPISNRLNNYIIKSAIGFFTGSLLNIVTNNNLCLSYKLIRDLCKEEVFKTIYAPLDECYISRYRKICIFLARHKLYFGLTVLAKIRRRI